MRACVRSCMRAEEYHGKYIDINLEGSCQIKNDSVYIFLSVAL